MKKKVIRFGECCVQAFVQRLKWGKYVFFYWEQGF